MSDQDSLQLQPGNFRLEGHIDVPSECIGEVEAALHDHVKLTRAEPGCLFSKWTLARMWQAGFLLAKHSLINKHSTHIKFALAIHPGPNRQKVSQENMRPGW